VLAAAPRLGLRVVGGLIVVFVLAFACAPVLLSHDAFSYVDYARLGVRHGLDPYVNAPDAAPADPAFAHVTWTETPSAYGPLFTLATYPLAWLPIWLAVAILKAVAAISVLGLAWVVSRLAIWRGVDPARAAAFVALNPLVLVHVVGGAHNDGLAMLLTTLGVAALVVRREASGGASLVASAAIKSSSLFVAPFALAATARDQMLMGRKVRHIVVFRPINIGSGEAEGQLGTGDRAEAEAFGAVGELHRAPEAVVVGQRKRRIAEHRGGARQLQRGRGAVEEGERRVGVQLDVGGRGHRRLRPVGDTSAHCRGRGRR
jgi:hypothetical protein